MSRRTARIEHTARNCVLTESGDGAWTGYVWGLWFVPTLSRCSKEPFRV